MDNLELLRNTALFKGNSPEELTLLLGLIQERHIASNSTIFTEQMPAESLYIVKNGTVRITLMAGEGEEVGLLLLGPGEFFGELALLQEQVRLVNARTDSDADLVLLTRKDFLSFIELHPGAGAKVVTAIARLLAMRVKAYGERFKELLRS